jgi:mRNA-decapping enzyme subunit 2
MQEALEQVFYRFLYFLPDEEKEPERFMVNMEQAHWFYEDELVRDLCVPSMKFPVFVRETQNKFDLLPDWSTKDLIEVYESYKSHIPVRGAIILNPRMDKVLLVTNFNGRAYSFPKGKINEGEADEDCAIREVLEEVGLDISEMISREDYLEIEDGHMRLYIVSGASEDFEYLTRTKGEIGKIEWVKLDDIPSQKFKNASIYRNFRFNKVHKFLYELRKWIKCKGVKNDEVDEDVRKKDYRICSMKDFKLKKIRVEAVVRQAFASS